jgi:carboxy-terminal domain RNA polymerase II polypeptide A small phosphatase
MVLCCCCCPSRSVEDTEDSSPNDALQGGSEAELTAVVPAKPASPPPSDAKKYLLADPLAEHVGKKCLVLDLDETLVHSSFTPVRGASFVVPVEIDSIVHRVYVLKRPGVDEFLTKMAQVYEVCIFTASLSKYADPVIDCLDPHKTVTHRLFREHCEFTSGSYVKNMLSLGRDIRGSIIIDNSPTSYMLQPENAVPVGSWFDDPTDTELLDLIPFLLALAKVDDVRKVLDETGKY